MVKESFTSSVNGKGPFRTRLLLKRDEKDTKELLRKNKRFLLWILKDDFKKMVRKEVREVVKREYSLITPSVPRARIEQIHGAIRPQLHVVNGLPCPLYTGKSLSPVEIVIRGGNSEGTVVTGPLSSISVEMVVLDGDFGGDGEEEKDWTEEQFENSVVVAREGKGPLLTGKVVIALKGGIGTFGSISLTDNSSWTRSGRFKIGVRVAQGSGIQMRIREAISEGFVVKDKRGESYEKHDFPSLGDKLWRLKNISKGGSYFKRLIDEGIETVQQFLQFSVTNPTKLCSIIKMPKKNWEETLKHAQKCDLGDKYYMYSSSRVEVRLLLNSIYKVVGVEFDGCHSFQSLDDLPPNWKSLVDNLTKYAYGNQKEIVEFNGQPPMPLSEPLLQVASIPETSLNPPNPEMLYQNFLTDELARQTNQGQLMINLSQQQGSTQLFDPIQSGYSSMLMVDQIQPQNTDFLQDFLQLQYSGFESSIVGDYTSRWSPSVSTLMVAPNANSFEAEDQMLNGCNGSPDLDDEVDFAYFKALVRSTTWIVLLWRKVVATKTQA